MAMRPKLAYMMCGINGCYDRMIVDESDIILLMS